MKLSTPILTRRRFAIILAITIFLFFLGLLSPSRATSSLASHAGVRTAPAPTDKSPNDDNRYLYSNTLEAGPVLEHGINGNDFTTSKHPRVVEFYDPNCGACQAFASNYVEVAKKVQAQKSGVEFYAVSCGVHRSLCYEIYSAQRVPKILVFPDGDSDESKEVQKGSGTIYFLSQRLLKALRSQEEIAADLGAGISNRRSLREYESDEDESVTSSTAMNALPKKGGTNESYQKRRDNKDYIMRQRRSDGDEGEENSEGMYVSGNKSRTYSQQSDKRDVDQDDTDEDDKSDIDVTTEARVENGEYNKPQHNKSLQTDYFDQGVERLAPKKLKRHIPPPPPRPPRPVGGELSDPNPSDFDPKKLLEFQSFVAKKRDKHLRHEKFKHPIKALLGERKKESHDGDDTTNDMKKSKPHPKKIPDLRPEAQTKTTGQKLLSKVPIVKRAFKRSKAEETLNDAALSFTRGLMMGVFKDSNKPLDYKRKAALKDWLDLMSVSLPPEMGLHELIDTLRYNVDNVSRSLKNLEMIVNKHEDSYPDWSDSCRQTKDGKHFGFFCGFWKLLHIASVGFAEQAGGLLLIETNPSVRIFSPKDAGNVVRTYMAYFFNCDKCSARFLAHYDDCSFDVCTRLSDETDGAPAESWREFPLWLWDVHNDISRSKANRAAKSYEKLGKKEQAKKWETTLKSVYPHIDQCISCFASDGTWDERAVYKHLEKEYWVFGHDVNEKVNEFMKYKERPATHGIRTYFLWLSIGGLIAWFLRKRKLRISGRHKKEDGSFNRFPSGKYRDS